MQHAFKDIYLLENFLLLKEKHKCHTFFETGTWHGLTAREVSRHIGQVITVEVDEGFFKIAKKNTSAIDNITIHQGSSPLVMNRILNTKQEGLIFFLDAHWNENWPLLDELKVIAEKQIRPVILIHDFFVPNDKGDAKFGYDSYKGQPLNLDYVRESLDKIYGENQYNYFYSDKVEINSGLIYIEPVSEMDIKNSPSEGDNRNKND